LAAIDYGLGAMLELSSRKTFTGNAIHSLCS